MRVVGSAVPRVEDPRLLSGRGRFVDDLRLPRMVHAAFLRSPVAHARIDAIDVSEARGAPGVVAVLTGADVAKLCTPMPLILAGLPGPAFHPLATDRVRYVGDPVALVVATTRYQAEDASELIEVDYDPLPVVVDPAAALAPDAPQLFDDLPGNVLAADEGTFGDVDAAFAAADRVVALSFDQDRLSPLPMETRGAVADYDPADGALTFHCNVQTAHALKLCLSMMLGLPADRVRVLVAADVGGAFGLKSSLGPENFAVAAAGKLLGRPVKWTEDRYEHLMAAGHARGERMDVEAAVTDDGTLLALRASLTVDQGAYPTIPFPSTVSTATVKTLLPGPYTWRAYAFDRKIVATNACSLVMYRGPWEIETWARERLLDEVARELGMDRAELRRRNLTPGGPEDRLISGPSLAGASNRQTLDRVLDRIGYSDVLAEQAAARAAGRCVGVGFATFLEAAPGPADHRRATAPFVSEEARVRLESNGHLVVTTAQVPQGQGHETTLAQVAADEMGVPFEHVRVLHGDTDTAPFKFMGTGGSLAATFGSGAVTKSTRKVKEKVLAIAGEMLEISPGDLEINDGVISPRGTPSVTLPLAQIAMQATMLPHTLPPGVDAQLQAQEKFTGEGITGSGWASATHACVVEIDLETGGVRILRYAVAEDCGRIINPAVVEGQIRGGVAQGIGQALYERAAYDADGNFLSSTFMDYLLPTSAEIPPIEVEHLELESDEGINFRGVGEGGAIVAPATVTNAIADALAPYGGPRLLRQSLTPAMILELAGILEG